MPEARPCEAGRDTGFEWVGLWIGSEGVDWSISSLVLLVMTMLAWEMYVGSLGSFSSVDLVISFSSVGLVISFSSIVLVMVIEVETGGGIKVSMGSDCSISSLALLVITVLVLLAIGVIDGATGVGSSSLISVMIRDVLETGGLNGVMGV